MPHPVNAGRSPHPATQGMALSGIYGTPRVTPGKPPLLLKPVNYCGREASGQESAGPLCPRVLHPGRQPSADGKHLETVAPTVNTDNFSHHHSLNNTGQQHRTEHLPCVQCYK